MKKTGQSIGSYFLSLHFPSSHTKYLSCQSVVTNESFPLTTKFRSIFFYLRFLVLGFSSPSLFDHVYLLLLSLASELLVCIFNFVRFNLIGFTFTYIDPLYICRVRNGFESGQFALLLLIIVNNYQQHNKTER